MPRTRTATAERLAGNSSPRLSFPNVIINDAHRFIYLAVPRTASTAITRSLLCAFPESRNLGQHRMEIPVELRDAGFDVVAGVRNPYRRIASHYLHRHMRHPRSVWHWSFHEYVEHLTQGHLGWWGLENDPPATDWLRNANVTFLLRYESLATDWQALPIWERAGFIPRLYEGNASQGNGRSWHALYTEEIAAEVYAHQREDFDCFGYHPESWRRSFNAAQ